MGSLALAGAVAGAGKGMVENAEFEQKMQAQKAAADYEQTRQEALERMRADNAKEVEGMRAAGAMNVAREQEKWHTQDVATETQAKASEGQKQREFLSKQGEANRENRKEIAQIKASAAVAGRGGKAPKTWTYHNITMPGSVGKDAQGNPMMIPGKQFSVLQHRDGRQFVQVGDKFMPYDASKDEVPDAGSVRRAAASEVDKLVQNPDQADNFLATYHYLPMQWFSAAQKMQDNENARLQGFGKNVVPATATVSGPAYLMSGGAGEQGEDADEAAADEQDAQSTQGVSGNGYQ